MRWSLILSITVLSTFSAALVIPTSDFVDLERRAGAKASSKTYRKKSEDHDYAYKFDHTGAVTREKLKPEERSAKGKLRLLIPKTDAGKFIEFMNTYISGTLPLTLLSFSIVDHVFENQMLNNHLAKHNLKYEYVFHFEGIIFCQCI